MQSSQEYRHYAEECERIAREGPPEHKETLLAIAQAWRAGALTPWAKRRNLMACRERDELIEPIVEEISRGQEERANSLLDESGECHLQVA